MINLYFNYTGQKVKIGDDLEEEPLDDRVKETDAKKTLLYSVAVEIMVYQTGNQDIALALLEEGHLRSVFFKAIFQTFELTKNWFVIDTEVEQIYVDDPYNRELIQMRANNYRIICKVLGEAGKVKD